MTDEFLKIDASFNRLLDEYKKYGSLCIGFDFDSTVYDYHKKGETYEQVRQLLRNLKEINCKLVCWTAQKDLLFVEQFLNENNIPFDGINTNGIDLGWESRKPFFSALLDDRAGLLQVYNDLNSLVKNIINEKKEEIEILLETQRGNCYVAVLSKCGDEEIASACIKAPEPGGDQWKKTGLSELDATKKLLHTMFTGFFNVNDYFAYACAWGVTIMEEDFPWIIKHIQKYPNEGLHSAMAYIQNIEPIAPHINNEFKEAIQELVDNKQEVWSDTDYSREYIKQGPYRTIKFD